MPNLVSSVLTKALVMLIEALLARLLLHLVRSMAYRDVVRA